MGYVTSGGYGFTINSSIALGYVPAELVEEGAEFAIDILGVERRARLVTKAPYDPDGLKLRS